MRIHELHPHPTSSCKIQYHLGFLQSRQSHFVDLPVVELHKAATANRLWILLHIL
jgi:hypothetical protein